MAPGVNGMWNYPELPPERQAPLALAYVGDAVFELFVRTLLLKKDSKVNQLHKKAIGLVRAQAQAGYYKKLEGQLGETELEIMRRGRNAKSRPSKTAPPPEYHMSTGFECLIGYLFLKKDEERLLQLLELALREEEEEHA